MKNYLFLIAVSFSFQAYAADLQVMGLERLVGNQTYDTLLNKFDATVGTSSDKFQQILELAKQGKNVSFNEVEGVYTGRCYDMVNRNLPRSSALAILQIDTNPSDGPLFPKDKLVIEGGYVGSADIADSKTKETITSELLAIKSQYTSVVESPLSVVMNDTSLTSHQMTYVKNQNYILGLIYANQDQEINVRGDGKITVKKGDIWAACYYFNKK